MASLFGAGATGKRKLSNIVIYISQFVRSRRKEIFGILVFGYAAYYFGKIAKKPRVCYRQDASGVLDRFAKQSEVLSQSYYPTWWAINKHASTLAGLFVRRAPQVSFARQLLRMSDGGEIALDWHSSNAVDSSASAPLVFVLPGLTGSSEANYVLQLVNTLAEKSVQCVVMNNRGLFGNPLLTPRAYSGAWTGDVRDALNHVHATYQNRPIICIGYSLGSNVLLKYLGEEGDKAPVKAAISISNPYNFSMSADALPLTYSRKMAQGLVAFFEKHREMLMKNDGISGAVDSPTWRAQTLREFDNKVTSVAFGFKDAAEYYRSAGCYQYMGGIAVPVLCISALDDPVVHPDAIPYTLAKELPNILLVVTDVGGHVGFPEGLWPSGRSWSDRLCGEFVAHVVKQQQ